MFRRRPLALILGAAAIAAGAAACGDDESGDATPATTAAAPAPAETAPATTAARPEPAPAPAPRADPGLPAYTAGFRDGLRLNRRPIPQNAGAPHGEVKNVYVNRTRARIAPGGTQRFPYPAGTVVTKTGSRGGDDAAIVALMRKVAGSDPEHGDWEFIEYSRSSPDQPYAVLAQDRVCWTCHVAAEATDWVFTELQ